MKNKSKFRKLITKWLLIFLLVVPVIISCNRSKVEHLESKNDSLMMATSQKDKSLNDFLAAFNAIQDNLDSIKQKEMMISERTSFKTELNKEVKDQINSDINTIYSLLLDTRDKLLNARKKLDKNNAYIKELEKMLDRLNDELGKKDQEIMALKEELESKNIMITALTKDIDDLITDGLEKSKVIEGQKEELQQNSEKINTVYYAIGTKKELRDNDIITLEGGFIGLGKAEKLKDDPDKEYFTKIDRRKVLTISIPGKKAEIVTPHPAGSYNIEGEGAEKTLKIIDYQQFWQTSKYLVIISE
jgi:hypothetical protein